MRLTSGLTPQPPASHTERRLCLVQVEVLDSRHHVLSPLSYVAMGLKAHMHDTRLDWVGPLNLTATQALIHVKCASPGVGSLHAAMAADAQSGGKTLRSNPAQIQVRTQ